MVNRGSSGDGDNDESGGGLTTSELLETLRFGSNAVFASSNELPGDNDMKIITDRNREESMDCGGKLKVETTLTAKDYNVCKELTPCQNFRGVDFKKVREERDKEGKETKISKTVKQLKEEWSGLNHVDIDDTTGRGKR